MANDVEKTFDRMSRPVGVRPSASAPEAMLSPKDIISMLRRHILLIVVMTTMGLMVGGVLVGGLGSLIAVKRYLS